jgi:deoxycytidylate deaminase
MLDENSELASIVKNPAALEEKKITSDALAATELFIGLVSPLGAELKHLTRLLTQEFKKLDCEVVEIKLSKLLHGFDEYQSLPLSPEEVRIEEHMKAGNGFRERLKRNDAMAMLAIAAVAEERQKLTGSPQEPHQRCIYLFSSLKREEEIDFLREVYGSAFVVLAAYAPKGRRAEMLAEAIADSHNDSNIDDYMGTAHNLLLTDEAERDDFGQAVRKAFPKADVFLNVADERKLEPGVRRFAEIIFSHPYHTPTKDEDGMFHAQAAALRSSSMGRQVGAVIANSAGSIIAIGTNEAPKFGGGLYWCDDPNDYRDFRLKEDSNDKIKQSILNELMDKLRIAGFIHPDKDQPLDELVSDVRKVIKNVAVMDLIEFYRPVHGEMAALMEAASRGVAVKDCTLYCTAFPCHECTRHIIAAGIKRVVYIEPYPKSRADELHRHEIAVDTPHMVDKVAFEPFVGIAPRWYIKFFAMLTRKDKNGNIIDWASDKREQRIRKVFTEWLSYIDNEQTAIDTLNDLTQTATPLSEERT